MIFHLTERRGEVRPPPNYVRGESPREWVGNSGNYIARIPVLRVV